MEATFCFVDIAGFTALTETHGAITAADLIDRFGELVGEALGTDGRVVDRAGDAIFVVTPTPGQGLAFLRRLSDAMAREPNFPIVRAGLHHGEAVERHGTYFGAAMNLAARVAGEARGGQALATKEVAERAADTGVSVVRLGAVALKNVRQAVELFMLDLVPGSSPPAVDPVCRMRVDPQTAPARLLIDGEDRYFCSLECAQTFLASSGRST